MPRKPPPEERQLILFRDHRRRYGARLEFRVLHSRHIGALDSVTVLLPDGTIGRVRPNTRSTWDPGSGYELEVEGFPTAAEAEEAGLRAAQALLLMALDLDFGVRLEYTNHQPPTVYDRTISLGSSMSATGMTYWPEELLLEKLVDGFTSPLRDRRLLLSMELLAASYLEANDRARFVMAVSALEPLAAAQELGEEVAAFVARALDDLKRDTSIAAELRPSLEGRLHALRKESVRQSLVRLCSRWFPGDRKAVGYLDYVYGLRSQILHDGAVSDLDIVLAQETSMVRRYVRHIYEQEFGRAFRVGTAA